MLRHERAQAEPHGGIIADEMGLGKTLQTIACMLGFGIRDKKTTLIVVPSENLIRQWIRELDAHTVAGTIRKPLHYKTKDKHPVFAVEAYTLV